MFEDLPEYDYSEVVPYCIQYTKKRLLYTDFFTISNDKFVLALSTVCQHQELAVNFTNKTINHKHIDRLDDINTDTTFRYYDIDSVVSGYKLLLKKYFRC